MFIKSNCLTHENIQQHSHTETHTQTQSEYIHNYNFDAKSNRVSRFQHVNHIYNNKCLNLVKLYAIDVIYETFHKTKSQ